ncbi:hypothetical protein QQF64_011915 [Cirrhinus molitorella]|uniref:Uncharacterized protein n=1 Tax=Cirrhinus molitorella TaxID=172907 RepID=A0ABR3LTZ5_9TELE
MSSPWYHTAVALSQWRVGESWTSGLEVLGSSQDYRHLSVGVTAHQSECGFSPAFHHAAIGGNLPQTPAVSLHTLL